MTRFLLSIWYINMDEILYKHVGQYRYTTEHFIKVMNSHYYNEMCIFKPRNYMEMCLDKCRVERLMYTSRQVLNLPMPMQNRRTIDKEFRKCRGLYVLVFGKDNPFCDGDYNRRLLYEERVSNYQFAKFLDDVLMQDDCEKLIKERIYKTMRFKLNDLNKARLRLIGIEVTDYGI